VTRAAASDRPADPEPGPIDPAAPWSLRLARGRWTGRVQPEGLAGRLEYAPRRVADAAGATHARRDSDAGFLIQQRAPRVPGVDIMTRDGWPSRVRNRQARADRPAEWTPARRPVGPARLLEEHHV
jgi:hypothetical protein